MKSLSPPQGLHARAMLGLLLALTGCDAGGGALEPGRYTYQASHAAPGGEERIRLEGILEIEEAEGDTMEGHWEVPQLHPELRVIGDAAGEAVVTAHPIYFGTLHHRIQRTGRGISCSGEYVWVADGGVERSMPVTCSITPGALDANPALDAGASPGVRPIESDTGGSG